MAGCLRSKQLARAAPPAPRSLRRARPGASRPRTHGSHARPDRARGLPSSPSPTSAPLPAPAARCPPKRRRLLHRPSREMCCLFAMKCLGSLVLGAGAETALDTQQGSASRPQYPPSSMILTLLCDSGFYFRCLFMCTGPILEAHRGSGNLQPPVTK